MRPDGRSAELATQVFEALHGAAREGRAAALCTVVDSQGSAPQAPGARMVVFPDGPPVGTIGGGSVEWHVIEQSRQRLADGAPSALLKLDLGALGMECGGGMTVFVDVLAAAERLIIFGAGHVGGALAPVGVALGFRVVVVDDRAEWANRERFPAPIELAVTGFSDYLAAYEPQAQDYVVIVTRGHDHDEAVLRGLVGARVRYLGMMGSRRKVTEMRSRLLADGVSAEALDAVDAPIGLPIGAQTPAELAVSLAARLVATRRSADVAAPGSGKA